MACRIDTGKVVAVGVDWLTVTTTARASSEVLWEFAVKQLPECLSEGEYPARWHQHGYQGWQGVGLSFGARQDGVLVRLSGEQARDKWRAAVAASDNVTRLDLSVDVELQPPKRSVARDLYRDTGHGPSRNGRPPTRSLVVSSDGGTTCYVGSRSSEQMGRCYDKGVEQKSHAPGHKWRWELELKGERAFHTASALSHLPDELPAVMATALDFFRARGGRVPPYLADSAIYNGNPRSPLIDRRLQWIARCVRPTVLNLTDALGRERMLGVLGLSVPSSTPLQSVFTTQGERS